MKNILSHEGFAQQCCPQTIFQHIWAGKESEWNVGFGVVGLFIMLRFHLNPKP